MLRIQILTPFRHQFHTKDVWLMAHESYYLDEERDKEEIKHILSSLFPYKEYIYINPEQVSTKLRKEIEEERGFTSIDSIEIPLIPSPSTSPLPVEEAVFQPAKEPDVNVFDKTNKLIEPSLPQDVSLDVQPKKDSKDKEEKAIGTVYEIDAEKQERVKHLSDLHWKKLKDIAEQYDISYTEKEDVIKKIISIEFE